MDSHRTPITTGGLPWPRDLVDQAEGQQPSKVAANSRQQPPASATTHQPPATNSRHQTPSNANNRFQPREVETYTVSQYVSIWEVHLWCQKVPDLKNLCVAREARCPSSSGKAGMIASLMEYKRKEATATLLARAVPTDDLAGKDINGGIFTGGTS